VSFTDRTLTCQDCGAEFVFSASEQEFYASKGLTNEPKRCPNCRRARKSQRGDDMGGGGMRMGGGGGGRMGEPRQMYPATCGNCGRETEVPFQPRTGRPVYCADCFRSMRPAGGGGGRGRY
jgi:CxxC-x17-CxxC domain-containing protein